MNSIVIQSKIDILKNGVKFFPYDLFTNCIGIYMEIKGSSKQINKILKKFGFKKSQVINETYWDIFKKR